MGLKIVLHALMTVGAPIWLTIIHANVRLATEDVIVRSILIFVKRAFMPEWGNLYRVRSRLQMPLHDWLNREKLFGEY